MRRLIVAANWKLQKNPQESRSFVIEFMASLGQPKCEIVIFPQALSAFAVAESLKGEVKWGGQNSYHESSGAFTGENSAQVLKTMGASYVLIGHSERRKLFGESDDLLSKKIVSAQKIGLTPMFCVGEDISEREAGRTQIVISEQLKKGLAAADFSKPLAIAYEPVWAIGTGKVATPEQAEEAHAYLRAVLKSISGSSVSMETPMLYGGSVKAENASSLIKKNNIDGFLVGGASLEAKSFAAIVEACKK